MLAALLLAVVSRSASTPQRSLGAAEASAATAAGRFSSAEQHRADPAYDEVGSRGFDSADRRVSGPEGGGFIFRRTARAR